MTDNEEVRRLAIEIAASRWDGNNIELLIEQAKLIEAYILGPVK